MLREGVYALAVLSIVDDENPNVRITMVLVRIRTGEARVSSVVHWVPQKGLNSQISVLDNIDLFSAS